MLGNPWAAASSSARDDKQQQPAAASSSYLDPIYPEVKSPEVAPSGVTNQAADQGTALPQLAITTLPTVDVSEFDPFAAGPSSGNLTAPEATDDQPKLPPKPANLHRLPPRRASSGAARSLPPVPSPRTPRTGPFSVSGSSVESAQPQAGSSGDEMSAEQPPRAPRKHRRQRSERQETTMSISPTGPVFDFQGFLTDLRGKSAEGVARYLKRWGPVTLQQGFIR